MDRMKIIEEWWRLNSGSFVNLDEILPFVVLHKLPTPTDHAPTPLLIGAKTLQAQVIGTQDPAAFRKTLSESWVGYSARIVAEQQRVAESGAPDISEGVFPSDLTGKGFVYRRGLFPVTTTRNLRMLMTYTASVTSH